MNIRLSISGGVSNILAHIYSWIAGATFLWLELSGMWTEWTEAATLGEFLTGQFWEYLFSVESIMNAWYAAIWPLYWWGQLG